MDHNDTLEKFIKDQLSVWRLAVANFRALKTAREKKINVNGLEVTAQFNPARIQSTEAEVDEASIRARKCFLCPESRIEGQKSMNFDGRKGRKYEIALNPFPVFPKHLVIISDRHTPQSIWNNYVDLADLAHHYTDYTFFYNGPMSGASAPDHLHFQACPRRMMPLETAVDSLLDRIASEDCGVPNGEEIPSVPADIAGDIAYLASVQEAQIFHYKHFAKGVFALRARTSKSMAKLFYRLLDCVETVEGDTEPRFNLVTWYHPGKSGSKRPAGSTHGLADFEYRAVVVLRTGHRSHHYASTGEDHLKMSPGCADMMGVFIVPEKEDFEKINSRLLEEMVEEVCVSSEEELRIVNRLSRRQPKIQVGIMSGEEIEFEIISDGAGRQKVSYQEGCILYNGALYNELYFEARTLSTLFAEPSFILHGVTIGIDFHWERKNDQTFAGSLKFIVENGRVVAVNVIGVEDYLLSVISSEMKPSASLEFLRAHAVISRSWVMSRIEHRKSISEKVSPLLKMLNSTPAVVTEVTGCTPEGAADEYVKWLDHEDHKNFDVCADDHCQRYQGLGMAIGANVRKAIDQTWGQVLMYDGKICDTRFHKACGGRTELFSTCWEDKDFAYLPSLPDAPEHSEDGHCFCDTKDTKILSYVLNDYDLETSDFFSWTVEYSREQLSALVNRRSGMDFGVIENLVPLETGPSGRIYKLLIKGSKRTMVVGKELIIRKWLSESHLKSSAFTITWNDNDTITLNGRGWGHGVGLCQIGAAVMAYNGYTYKQILEHYYPGAVCNGKQ